MYSRPNQTELHRITAQDGKISTAKRNHVHKVDEYNEHGHDRQDEEKQN